MSAVETRTVSPEEADLRLDRWFRRHYPQLGHGRLQKLLRTGQVRVDGRRVRGDARLGPGQTVRVPPLSTPVPRASETHRADPTDAEYLRRLILREDDTLMVLNKPPGLAVQGGTGTARHVDRMLEAMSSGGDRPRLVHRLDRDTSGVLVVAKSATAAAKLGQAFRQHRVDKLYWALVVGRPTPVAGRIDQPLAKQPGRHGEQVAPSDDGQRARTWYRSVARAGRIATWLALQPETGRTHQLRAHCAAIGSPILGDGKYGGAKAKPAGAPKGLMLHAREIRLPHPDGGTLQVTAPVPDNLRAAFAWLGFELGSTLPAGASLADFDPQ